MSQVIELRRYALHPSKRDVLIDLFERYLIEPQEESGMTLLGQFVDLDDPNSFVWLRGFPDMDARRRALTAFYGGPVWKTHRDAANATMIDSDNVLLLRPARPDASFGVADGRATTAAADRGVVAAGVHYVEPGEELAARDAFEQHAVAAIADAGASLLAYVVSEAAPNNYPALPVRGETAFAWFAGFADNASFEDGWDAIVAVHGLVAERVASTARPELLRLAPTPRSLLTGASGPCAAARRVAARHAPERQRG